MNEAIKQLHRAKLIPAITCLAFGIALIIARKGAMDVVVKIGAVMLGLCGVACIMMYLSGKVRELPQMIIGCILLIAGVCAWIYSAALVDFFPVITGIGLVLNGLSNLAALSNSEDNAGKGLILIFAALMIAGGVLIIINSRTVAEPLMIYMGIGYVVNGLLDLTLMYRMKNVLLNKGTNAAEVVDEDSANNSVK